MDARELLAASYWRIIGVVQCWFSVQCVGVTVPTVNKTFTCHTVTRRADLQMIITHDGDITVSHSAC